MKSLTDIVSGAGLARLRRGRAGHLLRRVRRDRLRTLSVRRRSLSLDEAAQLPLDDDATATARLATRGGADMTNADQNQDRLLDHNYDGIQEYDNPMPRWWVWHLLGHDRLRCRCTALEPCQASARQGTHCGLRARIADAGECAARQAGSRPAHRPRHARRAGARPEGHLPRASSVFATNCAPCHRPDGGGIIGPNLTDDYWLHGGTLPEIHTTITEGVLDKGMPDWGKILKPDAGQRRRRVRLRRCTAPIRRIPRRRRATKIVAVTTAAAGPSPPGASSRR